MSRHLTFANLASGAALVIAVAGGGVAVAGEGLGKNSVGSAQIKKSAIKSSDIKDGQVTGADIDESSLGQVPSAAAAGSAGTAKTAAAADSAKTVSGFVVGAPVSVSRVPSEVTVTVATHGPFTARMRCFNDDGTRADLSVVSSVNGAAIDSTTGSDASFVAGESHFVGSAFNAGGANINQLSFVARTPTGEVWQGQATLTVDVAGSQVCTAQLNSWG